MNVEGTEYILNPSLHIDFSLSGRRRSHAAKNLNFDPRREQEISGILMKIATLNPRVERLPRALLPHLDFLIESQILVPRTEVTKSIQPEWKLDNDALRFVPERMLQEAKQTLATQKLIVNVKHLKFQPGIKRPAPPSSGIPPEGSFPMGGGHIWIYDPGVQMWSTYSMAPARMKELALIARNKRSWRKLSEANILSLILARVLVPEGWEAQRNAHAKNESRRLRKFLDQRRFVCVSGLLQPMQIAIMRRFYRACEENGYMHLDEEQVRNKRFFMHNDALLRFVQRQSGKWIRLITGDAVVPSYSFLSAYLPDADLKRHVDRPQCAWNGSLLIDQNPEVELRDSWPIYLKSPKGIEEVRLESGDTLIYSGTDLPHWRNRIPKGHRQTLGLLHYVPIDFTGELE